MKIIQPSKRSKRSLARTGEARISSRSERLPDTSQSHDNVPRKIDAKKARSDSNGTSFDVSHSDYSESSRSSLDKAFCSKKRRRKSNYRNSLSQKDVQDHEVAEKDSEFDFDTSKLEAMPKGDQLDPEPYLEGKKRRRSELENAVSVEPLELVVDPAKKEFNELFARGVRLLAMREHSVKEITKKLFDKSEATDTIYAVVDDLLREKYLSDERFTESYIRARANRGFGPVKIRAELKEKGVSSSLIQDSLDEGAALWFDNAITQYQKKYGDSTISDYNAWTKRARFMQSRGFTMEHIHVTVPRIEFD